MAVPSRRTNEMESILREKRVKLHKFIPSQREIWTVVGSLGDHLVIDTQPYCTCGHFYFSVLGGKDESCYHIRAIRQAKKNQVFDLVEIDDADYGRFLYLLTRSIPIVLNTK